MSTPRLWAEYSQEQCYHGGHNHNVIRYHLCENMSLFRICCLGVPSKRYYAAAGDKRDAEIIFRCIAPPTYVFVEAVRVCGDEAERVLCDPANNIII